MTAGILSIILTDHVTWKVNRKEVYELGLVNCLFLCSLKTWTYYSNSFAFHIESWTAIPDIILLISEGRLDFVFVLLMSPDLLNPIIVTSKEKITSYARRLKKNKRE